MPVARSGVRATLIRGTVRYGVRGTLTVSSWLPRPLHHLVLAPVLLQLPVQRAPVDAEPHGGPALVSRLLREHVEDVGPLELLERRARGAEVQAREPGGRRLHATLRVIGARR